MECELLRSPMISYRSLLYNTTVLYDKMAVKITKKVKYATALYHKINATRSTFNKESLMLFSKSAHLLHYAVLLTWEPCTVRLFETNYSTASSSYIFSIKSVSLKWHGLCVSSQFKLINDDGRKFIPLVKSGQRNTKEI